MTLQVEKFVKKLTEFILCFILAFAISRYGMPLYPITSWLVDHSYQYFSHYQDDIYELGADPVTFISLMVIIFVYSLVLYSLLRWLLKKNVPAMMGGGSVVAGSHIYLGMHSNCLQQKHRSDQGRFGSRCADCGNRDCHAAGSRL